MRTEANAGGRGDRKEGADMEQRMTENMRRWIRDMLEEVTDERALHRVYNLLAAACRDGK